MWISDSLQAKRSYVFVMSDLVWSVFRVRRNRAVHVGASAGPRFIFLAVHGVLKGLSPAQPHSGTSGGPAYERFLLLHAVRQEL